MNETSKEVMNILIPVIGLENAGKSTVTDALLQVEYSERRYYDACTKKLFHSTLYEPKSGLKRDATIKTNSDEHNQTAQTDFSIELRDPFWDERLFYTSIEIIDVPGINSTKRQNASR